MLGQDVSEPCEVVSLVPVAHRCLPSPPLSPADVLCFVHHFFFSFNTRAVTTVVAPGVVAPAAAPRKGTMGDTEKRGGGEGDVQRA